jgi:L-ribulose-5-phosphate 3-epimerase
MAGKGNVIACRFSSYGPFGQRAYEHIAAAGLKHVEIMVPTAERIDATAAELRKFGLSASSMHGTCDLRRPDLAQAIADQMPAFQALDCKILFVSIRRDDLPAETAYERLRQAGDAVAKYGVTIAIETHPDLGTNADVALETMKAVDHPNVRINFDTANLYFYNHGIDCVGEIRKIAPYVAAMHLKDTDGGYRHWHFPALGEGIVDFPGVFRVLDEMGYAGPYTLEIEGLEGEEKTEELVCRRVRDSVAYLRRLGRC